VVVIRVVSGKAALDDATLRAIRRIATETVQEVRELLPGLPGDLVLAVAPSRRAIPPTGELGAAVSPGRIRWRADPGRPGGIAGVAERELRFTLFHELHHQARGWVMRGGPRRTTFMDGPVCEGLASAFERDAAGRRAPWAEYPPDVEAWVHELMALPRTARYAKWMFRHPDGRRWIGYRAGTHIADRAIKASGLSAAQLVNVTTAEILKLAGYGAPAQDHRPCRRFPAWLPGRRRSRSEP
jgi:Predicted Zn-dependent protease (DUF2268)